MHGPLSEGKYFLDFQFEKHCFGSKIMCVSKTSEAQCWPWCRCTTARPVNSTARLSTSLPHHLESTCLPSVQRLVFRYSKGCICILKIMGPGLPSHFGPPHPWDHTCPKAGRVIKGDRRWASDVSIRRSPLCHHPAPWHQAEHTQHLEWY